MFGIFWNFLKISGFLVKSVFELSRRGEGRSGCARLVGAVELGTLSVLPLEHAIVVTLDFNFLGFFEI